MGFLSKIFTPFARQKFKVQRLGASQGFSPFEITAENNFASHIEKNLEDYLNLYRKRFGKTINTDEAKRLYKPYDRSRKDTARFSRAVYSPAKALVNELYEREIQSQLVEQIVFMGGGTASGKSSGLKLVESKFEKADVFVDGTLANAQTVKQQISNAMDRELSVDVIFVFCPIEIAVNRAVLRAGQIGRALSLDVMAESHFYAPRTLIELDTLYSDNRNFTSTVIDNTDQSVVLDDGVKYIADHLMPLDNLRKIVSDQFQPACDEFKFKNGHELPAEIRKAFEAPGRDVNQS